MIELPEDQIDALSTISGSGPAYVFHAIERWTDAAIRLGFTRDTARALVEKTFTGALALLDHSGEEPRELRRRVTSSNGTTANKCNSPFSHCKISLLLSNAC